MINKKFLKKQFLKEWDYYVNNRSLDYKKTPLFYKINLDLSSSEFEVYIKNFYKWVQDDNISGYNMLDKMFHFKEIELFKIKYNNKNYPQKDHNSAITWIKRFLQDNNFTINELLSSNKNFNFKVFSLEYVKDYSKLEIENQTLYFQHRNWGLDKMTKDKGNQTAKTEGWGKLEEKLEILNLDIIFTPDGNQLNKFLGSARDSQYYPN